MSNTIRGRERGTRPRPAPGQTRYDAARERSRAEKAAVVLWLMRVGAPILAFLAVAFAVAAIPTRHEAQLFDRAPSCSAVPESPVSTTACREEQSSAITAVTFHPRKGKQSAYTDVTFDVGSTQSVDGDRTADVSVGDEALVTLWKGQVTDFALHQGTEHHGTNDNPDHIADSRAATAAILLCLAVVMFRVVLWGRLIARVRAARFATADGALAVMLVATCVIAAEKQASAELVSVTATVAVAGASMAMGRLAWIRAGAARPDAGEAARR